MCAPALTVIIWVKSLSSHQNKYPSTHFTSQTEADQVVRNKVVTDVTTNVRLEVIGESTSDALETERETRTIEFLGWAVRVGEVSEEGREVYCFYDEC